MRRTTEDIESALSILEEIHKICGKQPELQAHVFGQIVALRWVLMDSEATKPIPSILEVSK